jgi:hypothetical protein
LDDYTDGDYKLANNKNLALKNLTRIA